MKVVVIGGTGLIGSQVVATRRVIADPRAPYFGVVLDDRTLVPATTATESPKPYADWLADSVPAAVR